LAAALPCVAMPRGFKPLRHDVTIHGICADCGKRK
jgi:Fe2+ or Zn2+ uptake regulation protein